MLKNNKPFIRLLLKYNLTKTEQTASGMLLAVTVINFLISAYLLQGTISYASFFQNEPPFNEEILSR
ncbi:MAG: hypothetical protein AAB545_00715 [Patescibacteria group bacterium]